MQRVITTESLRKKIREYTLEERANARTKANDSLRFGLGEIKSHVEELTEKDVQGMAGRIKRRKHATEEDMYRLSHAFLQSNENINAFANTTGALQILIKELTGSNSTSQISAIECLCNLSLGEAHVCEKICSMAGSYLVTYLDSSEKRLKQTSLWTLANLIATSTKCVETLYKMELLRKLSSIYTYEQETDLCEDAAICLQIFCLNSKDFFNESDFKFIFKTMQEKCVKAAGSEYHLQIIFNCNLINSSVDFDEAALLFLISFALHNLHETMDVNSTTSCRLRFIYAIRILANLLAKYPRTFELCSKQLQEQWQSSLSSFLQFIFNQKEKEVLLELLWLLRNLIEVASKHGLQTFDLDALLENLNVPQNILS